MREDRPQERGQVFFTKKKSNGDSRQMGNDGCIRPCLCRLISMLEFQFAVDRTKARLLENPLELKGKQTRFGVKHRSAATIRSFGTNILQRKYAITLLTHMGRGYL